MSLPRNNLDELARKHALLYPQSPPKPATPLPTNGKAKFKPAKSMPTGSTPGSVSASKLGSFSTPGFGKTKPPPLNFPSVVDNSVSYIDVSSTESTPLNTSASSIRIPSKRHSGSLPTTLPVSPPKRPRIERQPDKENVSYVNYRSDGKGKARAGEPSFSAIPASVTAPRSTVLPSPRTKAQSTASNKPTLQTAFESLAHDVDLHEKDEQGLDAVRHTAQDLMKHCDKMIKTARTDPGNNDLDLLLALSDWLVKRDTSSIAESSAIRRGERVPVSRPSTAATPVQTRPHNEPLQGSANVDEDEYWEAFPDEIDISDDAPLPTPETPPATQPRISPPVPHPHSVPASTLPESRLEQREYYPAVLKVLKKVFHLEAFRPKQLEAICAAMDGKDVFVLFPTGSGKSLTFQIPAVCQDGVTVVVSPLMSLMNDQVCALQDRRVAVAKLSSDMDGAQREEVKEQLRSNEKPKLLYVTPEQLQLSNYIRSTLLRLYELGKLSRFVIDEAHCISDWGRRFRASYQNLTEIRQLYPTVPISALTATANAEVEQDIVARLAMKDCVRLRLSFNRKNLDYEVRAKKGKACIEEIATFIRTNHAQDTGIIYCHSRANCEEVAKALRDRHRLNAKHYHASMNNHDRVRVQKEWNKGDVLIIVATVAFGMGIDKADVRYVIHYSLPATLSNYYQETGRAGRDGQLSKCILFYTWADVSTRLEMIRKEENTAEEKRWQEEDFWNVVRYCQTSIRCRRQLVLDFFGEQFDPANCGDLCDNCRDKSPIMSEDHTDNAIKAVTLFETMTGKRARLTKNQLVTALRGSKIKAMVERGYCNDPLYGCCKHLSQSVVEQLVDELLFQGILTTAQIATGEYTQSYLQLGPDAHRLKRAKMKFTIEFRVNAKAAAPRQRKPRGGKAAQDPRPSTSVGGSSNVNLSRSRSNRGRVPSIPEDDGDKISLYRDDSDEGYVDDDIEEIMTPPPVARRMGTRAMPSASQSLAIVESDIEEENSPVLPRVTLVQMEDLTTSVEDDDVHVRCKNELMRLRDEMREAGLLMLADDLLTEEALDLLAVMLPNDRQALSEQLADSHISIELLGEYDRRVLSICTKYHMQRRS